PELEHGGQQDRADQRQRARADRRPHCVGDIVCADRPRHVERRGEGDGENDEPDGHRRAIMRRSMSAEFSAWFATAPSTRRMFIHIITDTTPISSSCSNNTFDAMTFRWSAFHSRYETRLMHSIIL